MNIQNVHVTVMVKMMPDPGLESQWLTLIYHRPALPLRGMVRTSNLEVILIVQCRVTMFKTLVVVEAMKRRKWFAKLLETSWQIFPQLM